MTDLVSEQPQEIQEAYRAKMNVLCAVIDEFLNGPGGARARADKGDPKRPAIGFFLSCYEMQHEGEGRFNYISNSDKADVRVLCKEVVARIDGRMMREGRA